MQNPKKDEICEACGKHVPSIGYVSSTCRRNANIRKLLSRHSKKAAYSTVLKFKTLLYGKHGECPASQMKAYNYLEKLKKEAENG